MDKQQRHAAITCSMDMQYGHAACIRSMAIRHGHSTWTCIHVCTYTCTYIHVRVFSHIHGQICIYVYILTVYVVKMLFNFVLPNFLTKFRRNETRPWQNEILAKFCRISRNFVSWRNRKRLFRGNHDGGEWGTPGSQRYLPSLQANMIIWVIV